MKRIILYFNLLLPTLFFGQYPFEKFKSPKYESYDFKMIENENSLEYSSTLKSFFYDKTDLQIFNFFTLKSHILQNSVIINFVNCGKKITNSASFF